MDGLIEIFLFCGVLCYFFNLRPNNMLDVVSMRLQEVYAKWEAKTEITRNEGSNSNRFSLDELKRIGQQYQRKKMQDRDVSRKLREKSLYRIKESEPLIPRMKQKESFLQYCCDTCVPASRESLVNTVIKQHQPLGTNILMVKPGSTLLSKCCCYITHVASLKKFEYPMVTQNVWNNEKLKDTIKVETSEKLMYEGYNEKRATTKVENTAKNILLQMESRCSDNILKIIAWLIYKLLPKFIQSAIVLPSQMEMLKKANSTGLPLIFLPLHRSHLDYVMISFIMATAGMKNPLIAAGDNLKIPFFGRILRGLGAFFIKRRMDSVTGRKDVLYRTILQTYVMENLRIGHNMEFFMEGGRTRTGKPCIPKSGILSIIVDAYMDGIIEDALLIPVAMNYERLVDGNFVREQLGQQKKAETFTSAIKAIWTTLSGRYGIVKVDFCQPVSLREMVKTFQTHQNRLSEKYSLERPLTYSASNSSIYATDVVAEEHRQLVDNIARHVIYDSSKSMPIMSTNILSSLLLTKFRSGGTLDKLVDEFDIIRRELERNDRNTVFCGETTDIVKHALDILGPDLVTQQQQEVVTDDNICQLSTMISPVLQLSTFIELSYYSNTMLLHYIMESILVTALYAELNYDCDKAVMDTNETVTVYQKRLVERALKLCDILRYEFILYRPCQELVDIILDTIQKLLHMGVLNQDEETYLEEELWSKRVAKTFDDSSDEEYSRQQEIENIQYKMKVIPQQFERVEFMHLILRPLIDTYSFSANALKELVGRVLPEDELLQHILKSMKSSYDIDTNLPYGESICIDPLKNAIKFFEKREVLQCYMNNNKKMYFLSDAYNTVTSIDKLYNSISCYRSWYKQS